MIIEEKKAENFNCHYPDATHCVGSRCMAWRWDMERNPDFAPIHPMVATDPKHPADVPNPYRYSTTHGYCGLAGRP